jgi:hypothetical protein
MKYGLVEQVDTESQKAKDLKKVRTFLGYLMPLVSCLILIAVTPQNCSIRILSRIKVVILLLIYFRIIHLLRIPISLAPPFLCFVLLNSNIANTIDITAIKAEIRKVRSYDSGDGNEAETVSFLKALWIAITTKINRHIKQICQQWVNHYHQQMKYIQVR